MLAKAVRVIDTAFQVLLATLMAVMVLCVTWQIVSRYVLDDPSSWTEELARFLLVWIGLLGGSYAFRKRMHLGLDLLAERLTGRPLVIQHRLVNCAVIFFAATVLVGGGAFLIDLTYDLRQYSPALGIPMAYVYVCLPVSGLMLILYGLLALAEGPPQARRDPTDVSV
jgi:TRAP-type C4-dicarboxylate transport system permease small subunit